MNRQMRYINSENAIIFAIVLISSLFYIWLIDNPLKYGYVVYVLFAYVVLKKIYNSTQNQSIRKMGNTKQKYSGYFYIDWIFFLLPLILIGTWFFQISKIGGFTTIFSLLLTAFAPGYFLFRTNKQIRQAFSNLEFILLVFFFSYIITAILWLIIITLGNSLENYQLWLNIVFLLFGLWNLVNSAKKQKIIEEFNIPLSFSGTKDKYGILMIVIIYAFSHLLLYPDIVYSYIDITRHYAYGVQLARDYGLYLNRNWGNILSHLFESAYIYSSRSNVEIINMVYVSLNFLYPLAFYGLIKRVFGKFDHRLPILVTWIYIVGSLGGIGWIYYLKTKIGTEWFGLELFYNNFANTVYNQTFKSNSYGFLPSYFRPINVSLMIFFFLIAIIQNKSLSRKEFISIFAILLTAMYLVHVVEASILSLFLGIWPLISKSKNFRIKETLIANIIGVIVSLGVFLILNLLKGKIPLFYLLYLGLLIILSAFTFFFRVKIFPTIEKKSPFNFLFVGKRLGQWINKHIPRIFLTIFLIALLTWVTLWDSYDISVNVLNPYRQIPWFFQSLRLGIVGLVGMLYFQKILSRGKYAKEFDFFLIFSIFAFIFGRMMTFINIFIIPESPFYWETRFEVFIIIPWVIFAVLESIERFDIYGKKNQQNKKKNSKNSVIDKFSAKELKQKLKMHGSGYFLLGLLFFSNFSTVLLNLEVRWGVSAPLRLMTIQPEWEEEDEGILFLSTFLDNEPNAAIITISSRTYGLANLAGPAKITLLEEEYYAALNPTGVLMKIYESHYWRDIWTYNNIYFYLSQKDITLLKNYDNSFLQVYIKTLPVVFNNSQIFIYNISQFSFPNYNSNTALILPNNDILDSENCLISSALLSQAEMNYSVVKENWDYSQFENLLLTYDIPNNTAISSLNFDKFDKQDRWIIQNNTNLRVDQNMYYTDFSNLIYPVPLLDFNVKYEIVWQKYYPNASNIIRILFDQNLDSKFSYIQLNLSGEGRIIWSFYDEFTSEISYFPTFNSPEYITNSSLFVDFRRENNTFDVSIDGDVLFSLDSDFPHSYIGISHLINTTLGNFSIQMIDKQITEFYPDLMTSISFYEDLAQSGKNVMIFNTNGYQYFSEVFFNINSSVTVMDSITYKNQTYQLPHDIETPELEISNNEIEIVANYSNGGSEIPFIVEKQIGTGKIIYINLFPIISSLNLTNTFTFDKIFLQTLFSNYGLTQFNFSNMYDFLSQLEPLSSLIFLNASIESNEMSILSRDLPKIQKIQILYENQTTIQLTNLTKLEIRKTSGFVLTSSKLEVSPHLGNTEPVFLQNDSIELNFVNSANELFITTFYQSYNLSQIMKISFLLSETLPFTVPRHKIECSEILLRLPIEPEYLQETFAKNTNNIVQIKIQNNMSFKIISLGPYLAMLEPILEYERPINKDFYYNELESIPIAFLWGIILVAISQIYRHYNKKKKIQKTSNLGIY